MSSRAPIQVPEELKNTVDELKDQLPVKTQYEVIQYLVDYYKRNEKQKERDAEARDQERARRIQEDLTLGRKRKHDLETLAESFNLKSLNDAVDLLMFHFESSDSYKRETLHFLTNLKA